MNNKSNKTIIIAVVLFVLSLLLLPTITKRAETKRLQKEAQQERIEANKKKIKERKRIEQEERLKAERLKKEQQAKKEDFDFEKFASNAFDKGVDKLGDGLIKGFDKIAENAEKKEDKDAEINKDIYELKFSKSVNLSEGVFLFKPNNYGENKYVRMVGISPSTLPSEANIHLKKRIKELIEYKGAYIQVLDSSPEIMNYNGLDLPIYDAYIWFKHPRKKDNNKPENIEETMLQAKLISEGYFEANPTDEKNEYKEKFLELQEKGKVAKRKREEDRAERLNLHKARVVDVKPGYQLVIQDEGSDITKEIDLAGVVTYDVLKAYQEEALEELKNLVLGKDVYIEEGYGARDYEIKGEYDQIPLNMVWLKNPLTMDERLSKENIENYMVSAIMIRKGYFHPGVSYEYGYTIKKLEDEAFDEGVIKWRDVKWEYARGVGRNPNTGEIKRRN